MSHEGWIPVVETQQAVRERDAWRKQAYDLREELNRQDLQPLTLDALRAAWEAAEDPDDWAARTSATFAGLITPKALHDIATRLGDPVQGIRCGQHWTALVPPHARHLIATSSRGEHE